GHETEPARATPCVRRRTLIATTRTADHHRLMGPRLAAHRACRIRLHRQPSSEAAGSSGAARVTTRTDALLTVGQGARCTARIRESFGAQRPVRDPSTAVPTDDAVVEEP